MNFMIIIQISRYNLKAFILEHNCVLFGGINKKKKLYKYVEFVLLVPWIDRGFRLFSSLLTAKRLCKSVRLCNARFQMTRN